MVVDIFKFHDAETGDAVGEELTLESNYSNQVMLLDIATNATALTVTFEAQGSNGNWINYTCYNYTDGTTGVSTSDASNALWQVEMGGLSKFRTVISGQTGGTGTTIIGKLVGGE